MSDLLFFQNIHVHLCDAPTCLRNFLVRNLISFDFCGWAQLLKEVDLEGSGFGIVVSGEMVDVIIFLNRSDGFYFISSLTRAT